MADIKKAVSIVPNQKQKAMADLGFYFFIHFGMTTFTDKEWGDGKAPPSLFAPTALDTDQWCESVKSAGGKGVILTAKHHDGFCLWQTNTTEYSIKNSPYKGGKGDILAELRASCDKYGLKTGVYISPWDRNCAVYGEGKAYDDFYVAQLSEVLTGYGEIFCVWLDGACGSYLDGKPVQKYDFKRYYDTVTRLQPDCAISNCGPDVRWVGNEGGISRQSEWNVVPAFAVDVQSIMANSQQADGTFKRIASDIVSEDLGSREFIAGFDELMWYPAEVDVSIRPGWFYHKSQDRKVRSVNNLLNIYYNSVGGNTLLLLNAPPDRRGLIAERDVKILGEFGRMIEAAFSKRIELTGSAPAKEGFKLEGALDGTGTYSPPPAEKYEIKLEFVKATVDKVVLKEDTDYSQRVEKFEISTVLNGKRKRLTGGTVVGFNKIALFKPLETDNLTVTVTECRFEPYFKSIEVFGANGGLPKRNPFKRIIKYFQALGYRHYCARMAKAEKKKAL